MAACLLIDEKPTVGLCLCARQAAREQYEDSSATQPHTAWNGCSPPQQKSIREEIRASCLGIVQAVIVRTPCALEHGSTRTRQAQERSTIRDYEAEPKTDTF